MDAVKRIISALADNRDDPVLSFGDYAIEEDIAGGDQGRVLKVRNRMGQALALKLYRVRGAGVCVLREAARGFSRELGILRSLRHKNIVTIWTGGTAIWADQRETWRISEDVASEQAPDGELFYYLIMDHIQGGDISLLFPELRTPEETRVEQPPPTSDRMRLFEELVAQVASAIDHYHSQGIMHKDIKPRNILYRESDSTFILVDFGFARHQESSQDQVLIRRSEIFDAVSIEAGDYVRNDIAQFARVLLKVLPSLESEYDSNRYEGLESAIKKATHPSLEQRYENVSQFYDSVRQYFLVSPGWRLIIRLDEHLTADRFGGFNRKLRIPVSGSILLCEEVRRLVDSPEFQRLRGVRQLGPAIFVFPGANHTRFEHSLGTYSLSLRYVEELIKLPAFREVCHPIAETVKLIALSSLLHDIGHYPYSHWIEEIDEFPEFAKHEDRAGDIICNGSIRKLIEQEWGVDTEVVANIIAERHIADRDVLVNSFINSAIDIDKLDYLIRDSVHCGVNYGRGIDIERLLGSLYMDPDTNRICLTDKGRSSLLSILACRNIMYQEVYWHKTVRACDAMFKRFFYEYIKQEVGDIEAVKRCLGYSDDNFIGTLFTGSRHRKDLQSLIAPFAFKGRRLYKPAYIFFRANTFDEPSDTRHFFTRVLNASSYKQLLDLGNTLADHLKPHIPSIEHLDIIVEKTPVRPEHEIYSLDGFRIWNTRKNRFEGYPREVDTLNRYLENNVQAYIFCSPDCYVDLRRLALQGGLNEVLGRIR